MTVSTRTLDKMRPKNLRADKETDGYFRELERILSLLGSGTDNTGVSTSGTNAVLMARLNGAINRIYGGINLTCDCASITCDNTLITADIA